MKERDNRHLRQLDSRRLDNYELSEEFVHFMDAEVVPRVKLPGYKQAEKRTVLRNATHNLIIAKYGLAAGVTDAMVAELDEAYGKPNPTESQFCLKNAWHAARGFTGEAV